MSDNSVRRIAVIGGTFAPPTIAHCALLRMGMEFSHSDIGIWAPSSNAYMKLWRKDAMPEDAYLNTDMRMGMLDAVCKSEKKMLAYYAEMMKTENAYTFDTLTDISVKYGAKVSFIMGADLLGGLNRWHRAKELVEKFDIFVSPRGDMDIEKAIAETGLSSITAMPFSREYNDISATEARRLLASGDYAEAGKYVHPAAMEFIMNHESILK